MEHEWRDMNEPTDGSRADKLESGGRIPSDPARTSGTFPLSFRSILFERSDDEDRGGTPEAPAFFRDLNLDQIVDAITAGRKEYDLKPFFYTRLTDLAAIAYRHEIMRDLENDVLSRGIKAFADRMRSMRAQLTAGEKLYCKYQREAWFLDAVGTYCTAVQSLLHDLQAGVPASPGLRDFQEFLAEYAGSGPFKTLAAGTERLKSELAAIRYCLAIKGDSVTVRHYDSELDYSAAVVETFAKFQQGAVKDYRVRFHESGMNHVEAKILEGVAQLNAGVFSALDEYCNRHKDYFNQTIRRFDREIQFYVAWLDYTAPLKRAGLNFCYPEVSATRKQVESRDGFDLALAGKLVRENSAVVCNDFMLSGPERIFVVTGPNQGGKTTFARTFGQMHYLASLGCTVPGTEARLFLFDQLFTHFEREEDITTLRGKLEDDLTRVHAILQQATPNSLIIINEIFASTTLKDALYLSRRVLGRISDLDSLCVCVTFLDELSSANEKTVSVVAAVAPADPTMRTFKIERRPADGLAYARAIAEKYHVTYERLKPRLEARLKAWRPMTGLAGPETGDASSAGAGVRSRRPCLKAHLMFRDRDFPWQEPPAARRRYQEPERRPKVVPNEDALTQDLELNTLFKAMSGGDPFLFEVARQGVLSSLQNQPETILYRQAVLQDCLQNYSLVASIYDRIVETIEKERRQWYFFSERSPSLTLNSAVRLMEVHVETLRQLRKLADEHASQVKSEGFSSLFALLQAELPDSYFTAIEAHLQELELRHGVLLSAQLSKGNQGTDYMLRKSTAEKPGWFQRLFGPRPPAYTFRLDARDEAGARILGDLQDRGLNLVANALAQSFDHILAFFALLRRELGFYVGCVNLHRRLEWKGVPVCFPVPTPASELGHTSLGLRDACLALTMERPVVGNNLSADGKRLLIITGANQGGKSTFLRSLGLAQLMMQSGLYVAAESFSAAVCRSLFTHYKREEDVTMTRGKLDEELDRMSAIADALTPHSMLLFNESFAATNEREGSEIARQIVRALLEAGVKVCFVTHLYEFAFRVAQHTTEGVASLRAERQSDGRRTFKLLPGEPLTTSFAADLYKRLFCVGPQSVSSQPGMELEREPVV